MTHKELLVSEHSVDRVARAGDPIAYAAERVRLRTGSRTHAEEMEAIAEDEATLGRPHTPSERDAFVRGFHGREYAAEVRLLAKAGMLDDEDDEE
jgi:hypothetical protein